MKIKNKSLPLIITALVSVCLIVIAFFIGRSQGKTSDIIVSPDHSDIIPK